MITQHQNQEAQIVRWALKSNKELLKESKFLVDMPKAVYDMLKDLERENIFNTDDKSIIICETLLGFFQSLKEEEITAPSYFSMNKQKKEELREKAFQAVDMLRKREKEKWSLRLLMGQGNHYFLETGKFLMEMPHDVYNLLEILSLNWFFEQEDFSLVIWEAIHQAFKKFATNLHLKYREIEAEVPDDYYEEDNQGSSKVAV